MEPGSGNQPQTPTREEPTGPVPFRGVRMRKWGKWVAEVRLPRSRKKLWLGSYADAEKAARAYDAALCCLKGPNAVLNFPERRPDIPSASNLSLLEIRAAAMAHAHDRPRRSVDQAGPAEAGEVGRMEVAVVPGEPSPIYSPEINLTELPGEWNPGNGSGGDDDPAGTYSSPLWNHETRFN
ncbi:ethylene-responsive transcription factor RAP2-1-like [Elaeis guineensis]|uniref:Ethylene-responsive transcription factor RAP2-1-like n=1 Tax=Elaeis guineensis var. tenera TaxID=51953 RepID=A0A6I9S499_ELAGV|nr:ethylene-responsive transcription factor RAP2-1-like [Elaeis guineensis]